MNGWNGEYSSFQLFLCLYLLSFMLFLSGKPAAPGVKAEALGASPSLAFGRHRPSPPLIVRAFRCNPFRRQPFYYSAWGREADPPGLGADPPGLVVD
ncbi:MAG: hypothetical protein LBF62_03430 [Tannerellaceae bacterium]|nr:hypothetical protein [Tannerellaceae bacterium]